MTFNNISVILWWSGYIVVVMLYSCYTQYDQTKDYKIGFYLFPTKHAAL
jgi:hypothetical protein